MSNIENEEVWDCNSFTFDNDKPKPIKRKAINQLSKSDIKETQTKPKKISIKKTTKKVIGKSKQPKQSQPKQPKQSKQSKKNSKQLLNLNETNIIKQKPIQKKINKNLLKKEEELVFNIDSDQEEEETLNDHLLINKNNKFEENEENEENGKDEKDNDCDEDGDEDGNEEEEFICSPINDDKEEIIKEKIVKKRKKKLNWEEFPIPNKCELKIEDQYKIFVTEFGKNGRCDIIGIDVGFVHLAIVGICKRADNLYEITHMSMISLKKLKDGIHFCLDAMIDLFVKNDDFDWVRNAKDVRIELQLQVNPTARSLSFGLRSHFRTWQLTKNLIPSVDFIHANNKYKIAAKFCSHCEENPKRMRRIKGIKGKAERKELSIEDFTCWCQKNDFNSVLSFYEYGIQTDEQMHDYSDAFFIAMYPIYFPKTKRVSKKKQ